VDVWSRRFIWLDKETANGDVSSSIRGRSKSSSEWCKTERPKRGARRDPPPSTLWLPPRHATSFGWPRCRADRQPPPHRTLLHIALPLNPQHYSTRPQPRTRPGGAKHKKLPKSSPPPPPPPPLAPPTSLQSVPTPCRALPLRRTPVTI
jgi:hypothetical protein